jgi:hypothetical protein
MPEEEVTEQPQENASAAQPAAEGSQPASPEPQATAATPQPDVTELTREQLEDLRRKLQKRFH